ncbi:MAG TPA: UDP-glucose/GDP-mannose dehydrogenase family protein [Gemmatimonadales bacterium]|nr:UDP-glucose/GDP-mannose dehydrogenase family protein [Gemmatimonadales bacterium]
MRISIIGTGYVGLVTGASLAEKGHDVICVDIDPDRVAALNAARAPIFELGLDELLTRNVGRRLSATTDLADAVRRSDLTFIAVGTPFDGATIDLTAVRRASEQVGQVLRDLSRYHVVVVKSTVVPGTTDGCVLRALESASGKQAGRDFGIGMNPEFLSEGEAVHDFMFPDRIVIGGIDERSIAVIDEVYRPFPDAPRIRTNTRTAEMIKYASNAILATLISFSNEMANLASALGGIDSRDVMRGVHLSQYFTSRDGENLPPITAFLRAGCGYGGSCLPKDTKALVAHGRQAGVEMPLLTAVIRTNDTQPDRVVALLEKHWQDLAGVRVAVLGLAFKPGTSDVRESPAFPIMRRLIDRGAVVCAYDPVAVGEAEAVFRDPAVHYSRDLASAIDRVDAIVVVTPWDDFRSVPAAVRERAPRTVLVDCRGAFERNCVPRYEAIGY